MENSINLGFFIYVHHPLLISFHNLLLHHAVKKERKLIIEVNIFFAQLMILLREFHIAYIFIYSFYFLTFSHKTLNTFISLINYFHWDTLKLGT